VAEMACPTVPQRAPYFPPPYRSQRVLQLRLSCHVAGGGVRSRNGEVVGDRITGGSAKKILLLVQRNQTAFIDNSLAKSGIFSGISLTDLSTALKNRPDEKR